MIPLHVLALGIAIGQKSDVELKPSDLGDFAGFLSRMNNRDYTGAGEFVRSRFSIEDKGNKLAVEIIDKIRQDQKDAAWAKARSKIQFCNTLDEAEQLLNDFKGTTNE